MALNLRGEKKKVTHLWDAEEPRQIYIIMASHSEVDSKFFIHDPWKISLVLKANLKACQVSYKKIILTIALDITVL